MAKKKGSLSLSINAIVVLIMAITILGLGLGFIKKQFGAAESQFEVTNQKIKADIISELERSGDKLTFKTAKFEIKSGESKEFYIGIRNTAPDTKTFWMQWSCETALQGASNLCSNHMDPSRNSWDWFKTYDYIKLDSGESEAFLVKVQPSGTTNTYMGKLYVFVADANTQNMMFQQDFSAPPQADLFESKDFYLNVI